MHTTGPTFTPSEVAELTGVSTAQQRDWRRHGFMPETPPGWARYQVADLCRLRLFKLFAAQGIAPGSSKPAVERLVEEFAERCLAVVYGLQADDKAGHAVAVIWATGDISTHRTLQLAFDSASDEQQNGPCVVISLDHLATPFGIKLRKWVDDMLADLDQDGEQVS